jgi:hypothetical protein
LPNFAIALIINKDMRGRYEDKKNSQIQYRNACPQTKEGQRFLR